MRHVATPNHYSFWDHHQYNTSEIHIYGYHRLMMDFVICLNNSFNKQANSMDQRLLFHNVFSCIVYTIYFTRCNVIRGLNNHLVLSTT